MFDISDTRLNASRHILTELRKSYDAAISSEHGTTLDYWRSHRSSIALLVIEELNKRYSSRLKAIFEIQDFHAASAKALFRLYAESELDILRAAEMPFTNAAVFDAVVASYITRMQIADYILQSAELTNLIYFCNMYKMYSWLPEYLLTELAHRSDCGLQTPEQMIFELRDMLKDLSARHTQNCTDVYFALAQDKKLKAELLCIAA